MPPVVQLPHQLPSGGSRFTRRGRLDARSIELKTFGRDVWEAGFSLVAALRSAKNCGLAILALSSCGNVEFSCSDGRGSAQNL